MRAHPVGMKARMAANKSDIVSICKTKRADTTDMKPRNKSAFRIQNQTGKLERLPSLHLAVGTWGNMTFPRCCLKPSSRQGTIGDFGCVYYPSRESWYLDVKDCCPGHVADFEESQIWCMWCFRGWIVIPVGRSGFMKNALSSSPSEWRIYVWVSRGMWFAQQFQDDPMIVAKTKKNDMSRGNARSSIFWILRGFGGRRGTSFSCAHRKTHVDPRRPWDIRESARMGILSSVWRSRREGEE